MVFYFHVVFALGKPYFGTEAGVEFSPTEDSHGRTSDKYPDCELSNSHRSFRLSSLLSHINCKVEDAKFFGLACYLDGDLSSHKVVWR